MSAPRAPTIASLYLIAIVALALMAVVSVVLVVLFHPGDNTTIIASMIGIFTPVIMTILGFMSRENHMIMNSRMDEFKRVLERQAETDTSVARAEGVIAGKEQGVASANKRTDELNNPDCP